MFEHSAPRTVSPKNSVSDGSRQGSNGADLSIPERPSVSDLVTADHESIEGITSNSSDVSVVPSASNTIARQNEPTLALHIQMSLHPMTLADYLPPSTGT